MLPVAVTAMLAGCGQPGALYMPKKPAPPVSASATMVPPVIPTAPIAPAAAAPAAARSTIPAAQQ